jgi:hypothetical protein
MTVTRRTKSFAPPAIVLAAFIACGAAPQTAGQFTIEVLQRVAQLAPTPARAPYGCALAAATACRAPTCCIVRG